MAIGDLNAAFEEVMRPDAIERWRNQGRSLRLEPVLGQIVDAFRASRYTQVQQAQVLIAMAHVASDLGRPRMCLDHLTRALHFLDGVRRTPQTDVVLRSAWMQTAISHANLGHTSECIEFYLKVIRSDTQVAEVQTALCMGYLGYEYCDLQDFRTASAWVARALQACPLERDAAAFAKNLCNRGIVHFYLGDLDDARKDMEAALRLVGQSASPAADMREHGRVLSYLALVYLAQRRVSPEAVEELLTQSLALTRKGGDARRTAVTTARLGLVARRRGDISRAIDLTQSAIRAHRALGDNRNMTFELLDLAVMRHLSQGGNPASAISDILAATVGDMPDDISPAAASLAGMSEQGYLVELWSRCYRPLNFPDVE
jgi:tetratricopeptide (TPR) repeat protein